MPKKSLLFNFSLKKNSLFVENYSYLSALQIVNLVLPLVTYPYLIKTLGKELFGSVVFAQAIILYISVVISYGFNISGVKDVAVSRQNKTKLSEIASVIIYIKSAIFIFILILFLITIFLVPFLRKDYLLYIIFYSFCIGEIFFPVWFFQGIERLKYVTYVNLLSKLIFTLFVFILIKEKSDYLLFPLLLSLGNILGGLFGFFIMRYNYHVEISTPRIKTVVIYLKHSTPLFLSRVTDSILERGFTVLIGTFIGMTAVTGYDVASKIIYVFTLPFMILNQVLYPKIAAEKKFKLLKKIILLCIPISISIDLVLILLGKFLVVLLGGTVMKDSVWILYTLSPLVVINSLIYLIGSPGLVAAGLYKEFNKSITYSLVIAVILTMILVIIRPENLFMLIIISRIITNFAILIFRIYFSYKKGIFKYEAKSAG